MSHDPLDWTEQELALLKEAGLRRNLSKRMGPQTAAGPIEIDGQRLINFGSNDYLGLAGDSRLTAAVRQTLDKSGWGSGASPLVTGRASLHDRLERVLADFEGTEACLLFASGYAANSATVPVLVGEGDVIYSDAKNHASIIDGCRLSKARVEIFRHLDYDDLHEKLRGGSAFRRRLIATDSLFSMDGDLAPLDRYAELARRFDAMMLVDEAHATGVYGEQGRGVAEHLGIEDGVHIRIGTLSKAIGASGGFVSGPQRLIDLLANRARAYVFSTAAPEASAAAALEALKIVRQGPQRRQQLLSRAADFRQRLADQGWPVEPIGSQIVPLVVGSPERAVEMSASLRQNGLLVPAIRPPSVPHGESLLRVSLSFAHREEMIERLLESLGRYNPGA